MCAVAEAIQSALAEHGFIEDRHPFLDTSIGRDNGGTAGVAFDEQFVDIGGGLAGELSECKVIDDQQVRANEAA